jgi:hypothetical protein
MKGKLTIGGPQTQKDIPPHVYTCVGIDLRGTFPHRRHMKVIWVSSAISAVGTRVRG